MTNATQNRIQWIDEYKGFVLLLVCLFHVEQSFKNVNLGMEELSVMRMSAFFFISGVLFSTRRFSDFKSYAKHKTKVLLLPYIWLSLLFLALDPVVWNFDWFPRAPKMTVMNIRPEITGLWDYLYWNLAKIFVAGKSSIGSGPLWFVFTLYSISLLFFVTQKISVILSGKATKSPSLQKAITAGIAIACLVGGWFLSRNNIRLPLGIERDLTCLSFFALGWLCKDPIKKLNDIKGTKGNLFLLALTIIAFTLYAFVKDHYPWFSIMNNTLGKDFIRYVGGSLFGIAGLIGLFQLVSRLPDYIPIRIIKGILRNISRNALIILAVHWWILLILRIVFKSELDKPSIVWIAPIIVVAGVVATIPLFRSKLYKLIGKEEISARESLSIK